jgi:glycerophosphoryl diester phosphodiesterase
MKWLTARPIAHRGLHNKRDIIENTGSAFRAAIEGKYAIECDVQLTRDGDAAVFHDFELERLTHGKGLVKDYTMRQLREMAFKTSSDKMMSLSELINLTRGRATLIVEIKSLFDGDMTLATHVAKIVKGYTGKIALMSFDPAVVAHLREIATPIVRGIVAENAYDDAGFSMCSSEQKYNMRNLMHFEETNPHFISWKVQDLPTTSTLLFKKGMQRPVICWTVRTDEDKVRAAKYADQVTFEGYNA